MDLPKASHIPVPPPTHHENLTWLEIPVSKIQILNYTYTFPFEDTFDYESKIAWMVRNWKTHCTFYVGVYMLFIFAGRWYMTSRPRFELRTPLITWNIFLATFSIIGAFRTVPEILHIIRNYGFYHSVCTPTYIDSDKVSGTWTWLFILSKVPELGDTIFIVLRKQPLIFLHWYHHVTVLLYCWYSFAEVISNGRWFITMNYTVHAIMYSYYACKAMRLNVPKFIAMGITIAQLMQMIAGCYVNIYAQRVLDAGSPCQITNANIRVSLMMYFSYFLLFAQFFYNSYVKPPGQRRRQKELSPVTTTEDSCHSIPSSASKMAVSKKQD